MQLLAVLSISSLFGGMLIFAAGFGTLAFKLLDKAIARRFIRETFPYFYTYVLANSGVAAILSLATNKVAFFLTAFIFVTTIPNRQILMPAINYAADNRNKKTWVVLHGLSILITLVHIVFAGAALHYLL